MKSEDGNTYQDLPVDNPLVSLRVIGQDGQHVDFALLARGDDRPFGSGKLGYNVPGVLEWNGLKFRVSCNLILADSASPERIRTAKAQKLLADKKRVMTTLTSLGLTVAKRDRVWAIMQEEGNEDITVMDAIELASLEAREGHVPPAGHATK